MHIHLSRYVYVARRGPVTGSSHGLTSYQWLCVNVPWAGANSLNVTAPGKHKQAPLCTNATARVPRGNRPRWRGVMKKWSFKRRSAATSVCVSPTSVRRERELQNTWLHIHAVMCCCRRRHPPSSAREGTSGPLSIY